MTPGRDAVLRCEAQVPDVSFLLLRAGEEEPLAVAWSTHRSADLVLTSVGPQHAGTYSCRYRTGWPHSLLSELSDPVELRVAGELKPQEEGVAIHAQGAPRDPRRDSRGERCPFLPLETRPDSPGEPGMQPRDPCLPWRGILGTGHTPR